MGRGSLGVVGGSGIGVAGRIEGRDRVRLKGNDESESLRPPELAAIIQSSLPFQRTVPQFALQPQF